MSRAPALIRGHAVAGDRRTWRLSRRIALPPEVPVTIGFDPRRAIGFATLMRDHDGLIWAEAKVAAAAGQLREWPWLGLHVTGAELHRAERGRPLVTGEIAAVSLMRLPGDPRVSRYEIVS